MVKQTKKEQKAEGGGRKLFGTDGIRGAANEAPMTPEMAPDAPRLGMNGLSPNVKVEITCAIDASTPVAR